MLSGKPVIGEVGEFSISKPMPSLPLKLWNDPDGKLYTKSYFSKYPGKTIFFMLPYMYPISVYLVI